MISMASGPYWSTRWLFSLTGLAAFCLLGKAAAPGSPQLTYEHDVRPILQARCVTCHKPGDIAPMPLTSFKEVRPWARSIRQAVLLRAMPPWGAVPNSKHPFRNDRSLSKNEIDTIVSWVDSGAPSDSAGGESAAVPVPVSSTSAKPDVVVRIPGFAVPKGGSLPYSFLIVPLHLSNDTWVRSAEFHIDQRQVIHHINAFVRPPGSSFLQGFPDNQIFVPTKADRAKHKDGEKVFDRRQLLLGYEPGYRPAPWLDDGAKLIKAGSDLVFELHYNPNGKEVIDHSELDLYFSPSAPTYRVLAIDTLRDLDLHIPAGAPDYVSNASMTLAHPVRLLSIQPHMHYRGKSMAVRATYPDGSTEQLIDVPKYDFNWQTTYFYRDPITLPAGTRLDSVATFDNSTSNKFNPDPNATVVWGDQTTDEMHIAFLELVTDASADPETIFKSPPRLFGQPASTPGQ
jgi:hypothetical protein